jgi:hypothetical protein
MKGEFGVETCRMFLHSQFGPPGADTGKARRKLALTVSRQTGTGGLVIARKVAAILQESGPTRTPDWLVLDKGIVDRVLEVCNLPEEAARFMPEERVSYVRDLIEETLGLHPPSSVLVRRTAETILHLAEIGNVVLVGRGANVVTAALPHVFHVRLIGSMQRRVARLMEFDHIPEAEARVRILKSDRGRARYLRTNFSKDIDDALLYDLVLNTDRITDEVAARIIAGAAASRCQDARPEGRLRAL